MNEFSALRARARDRRDKAILLARNEYEAALVQIATLEQDLLGKLSSKHKTISQCVMRLLPRDEPFSTQSVYAALEAMDPARYWRKRSLDTVFTTLRERKIIRRIKRATIHAPAMYALADSSIQPPAATGDATLREVVQQVLTKPMRATEVLVAVREAGYETTMTHGYLLQHVMRELKRVAVKRAGAKWVAR